MKLEFPSMTSIAGRVRKCLFWPVMTVLLILGSFLGSTPAMAGATCTGSPGTDFFNFPASISVPRDRTATNIPLTNWVTGPAATNWWNCTVNASTGTGTYFKPNVITATGQKYSDGGINYTVFQTSKPGVGIIIGIQSYTNGCGWGPGTWDDLGLNMGAGIYPYVGYMCSGNGNVTNGGQVKMRLISTGLIEAGTLASSTPVMGYSVINNVPGSPGTGNKSFTISSVNFVALSCSVDNINVKLDDVKKSDFASATSLKTKAFAFTLKSCPAGMNTIQYRLDPLGTVISSTDGTFANATGPDMAQGVGLRITDSANTAAVRLGDSSYVVSGYSPASGNSSLSIPMNVSYYRTGAASAVTPGKVSGVAQLTVYYK